MESRTVSRQFQETALNAGWRIAAILPGHEATPEVIGQLLGIRRRPLASSEDEARREIDAWQRDGNRVGLLVNPHEPLECVMRRDDLESPTIHVPRGRTPAFAVASLSILVVVGLALSVFGARNLVLASGSDGWPSATGVVTSSEIVRKSKTRRRTSRTSYRAKVRYDYEVQGVPREGERIRFGDISSSDRSRAVAIRSRYPTGTELAVYYDPDDPSRSVLEPGVHLSTWLLLVIGLVFVGVGAPLGWLTSRAAKRRG